jgi:GT2 family glycosyltransferase
MRPLPADARVAVVILSFNQREQTLRCLEHLQALQPPRGRSTCCCGTTARRTARRRPWPRHFPGVLVEACPENLGVAGGRNAAGRRAIERSTPRSCCSSTTTSWSSRASSAD